MQSMRHRIGKHSLDDSYDYIKDINTCVGGQEARIEVASGTVALRTLTCSPNIDSSSNSFVNALFDFGGIPFLLWVWFFDGQVPCHPLPAWARVLAPSLIGQWLQHPNLLCTQAC